MKRLIIFSVALLLFGHLGCRKNEVTIEIKGIINSSLDGSGLAGVNVNLYTKPLGSSFDDLAESVQTDSEGSYAFEINNDKYENVRLHFEKENYFDINHTIPYSDLSTSNANTYDFQMKAQSWTAFVIKNNQPDSSDEFKLLKDTGKEDCESCCENGFYYYYGDVDTTVLCPNDANRYMKFYYWVNGNESNGMDSVYNTPFDTTYYEFNY
ncbi:MAG: hypothetical protein ACQERC_12435 [Bacteroidota bacterium]